MGEMADWFIEQEMTANPHWSLVGGRRKAKHYRQNHAHVCKLCGAYGLAWVPDGASFTLVHRNGTRHVCRDTDRLQQAAADFTDCDR